MRHLRIVLVVFLLTGVIMESASAQGRRFRGGRGGPGHAGRGPDESFVVDRDDFHFLLERHEQVRRDVTVLKDGVETITESDNAEVAARIQKHVAAMYQRVEQRRPIRMRDPLFAEIFRHADKIKMEFEKTDKGVRVVETSDDSYVADLIKAHAKVVSGFAKLGFEEAHRTHAIPGAPGSGGKPIHAGEEMADMVFVEFDRVYIPALALTNQRKPSAAKALARLSESWETRFVVHFHRMFAGDSEWPREMSRIAQFIALAEASLRSGDSQQAHEDLEPIRDLLTESRRRNGMEYPLDALSHFHGTMEAIVKPAMQLDADSLSDDQLAKFVSLAHQAEQEWKLVEQTKFDLSLFGKNKGQIAAFRSMLRAEHDAIATLQDALVKNDRQAVIEAARGLKPPFAKVYMYFGDFPK